MIYHYEPTLAGAERYLARELRAGRRGYILELRADCFEIRTWRG
jgi:hypothetical protein